MASSGSSQQLQSSAPDDDLKQIVDQRKRKRMISNRESARRSRMRKQQHLDELVAQVGQLTNENSYILTNLKETGQMYVNMEAENSVLRAQVAELTQRLNSLNEIIDCLSSNSCGFEGADEDNQQIIMDVAQMISGDDFFNPWNLLHVNQPIMASADMFMS